jgi:(1->4)-alpha-D-glucan 1-alpha-D-glucosylmutase
MTPRATWRMQFHKDFTFADAVAQVPDQPMP